jgi:anti-sigma regulatory factor (Ser/Thr protein kinase)
VRELVNRLARSVGFAESQSSQVALAVDEALANVIRHGYEGRSNARIWVKLWMLSPTSDGPGLRVVVEDLARQVDPALIKSRDLDDIRPGGLGVHIIREVMDSVVYEKRDPLGMRLIMEKRTNTPGKASRPGVACLSSEPISTSKDAAGGPPIAKAGHEPGKDHA